MSEFKGIGHPTSSSNKEYISGRKTLITSSVKNRTALYLRVSTADQKPDLQYDGLRDYSGRAKLKVNADEEQA
jgi:predicted site-specific integrase-resolvase